MVFRLKSLKYLVSRSSINKGLLSNTVRSAMSSSSHCSPADSYEEAVKTLNSLQTNAAIIQQSKKRLGQPNNNVADTRKYLLRSGVSQDMLDECLSIIHVAGTKGKGSTCAFTESILRQHGLKTGFYSSPHLIAVRERIRINGQPLSKESFATYFWDVFHKLRTHREHDGDMPFYFKFLTVMAFNVFLREKVDVAIIEVGIGGELDCTNIIRKPVVVGITSLGLDHTSLLGNTVELIANQKAGIMKRGVPAFTVQNQPGSSLDVLRQKAKQVGCPLTVAPPLSSYSWPSCEPSVIGLDSEVQRVNASLAVQLAHTWLTLNQCKDSSTMLDRSTAQGLRLTSWPGRAQIVNFSPQLRFYLDGAHTTDSVRNCLDWFSKASQSSGEVERVLIFNSTGEREPRTLLEPLWKSGIFHRVAFCPNLAVSPTHTTPDQSNFMVTSEQQLERVSLHAETWASASGTTCHMFPAVVDALDWLHSLHQSQKSLHVLVTGSLHLVGCVLGILEPKLTESTSNSCEAHVVKQHVSPLPLVGEVR